MVESLAKLPGPHWLEVRETSPHDRWRTYDDANNNDHDRWAAIDEFVGKVNAILGRQVMIT